MKRILFFVLGLIALPVSVFAAGDLSETIRLIGSFSTIVNMLIGVATTIALLVFIWGLVKYIAKAEDEGAKEDGRRLMINGAIALFVLFSIFGIIYWIGGEVGVTPGTPGIPAPRI